MRFRRHVLQILFAAAGLVLLVLLVRRVGPAALLELLRAAAPALPGVLLLEGARIWLEAAATWLLLHGRSGAGEFAPVLRAQLASYAVCQAAPAGRPAAEALKAGLLEAEAPPAVRAAAAIGSQGLALVAVAIVSFACAAASYRIAGASVLTWTLAGHALASGAAGLAIQLGGTRRTLGAFLRARLPRLARVTGPVQRALLRRGAFPAAPLLAHVAARAVQVVQIGLLAWALVGSVPPVLTALVANGVNLVGTAAGDLVPAHVGFPEGAMALAAGPLGLSVSVAVALALALHAVQLLWVAAGALTPLVWRRRPGASSPRIRHTVIAS